MMARLQHMRADPSQMRREVAYSTSDEAMAALVVLEAFGIDAWLCAATVDNPFGNPFTEWCVRVRNELPETLDNEESPIPSSEPDYQQRSGSSWWDDDGPGNPRRGLPDYEQ